MPQDWSNARKTLGLTAYLATLFHVLFSLIFSSPAVYIQFFEQNATLTQLAGLSMRTGNAEFVVPWDYNLSFQIHLRKERASMQILTSRRFLRVAIIFGVGYLFFRGYPGWFNSLAWHGGPPPISLNAFTIYVSGYVINLFCRE